MTKPTKDETQRTKPGSWEQKDIKKGSPTNQETSKNKGQEGQGRDTRWRS